MEALVRAFSGAKDVILLGDVGLHSLGDGSRVRSPSTAAEEMVSWQARLVHARELFFSQ